MTDEQPMIGITRRVVLGQKDDLTFQVALDPAGGHAAINNVLDMLSVAADRERMKSELVDRRQALEVAVQQAQMLDGEIERLARDRAAAVAGFQAAHQARARRSDFAPNESQRRTVEQFDAQIQAVHESKANFRRDKPIIEWQIACLAAKIAGEPEPDRPDELEQALHLVTTQAAA